VIRKKTQGVTENAEFQKPKNPDETFKNRNPEPLRGDDTVFSEDESVSIRDDSSGPRLGSGRRYLVET
jgi:hypothetical protein